MASLLPISTLIFFLFFLFFTSTHSQQPTKFTLTLTLTPTQQHHPHGLLDSDQIQMLGSLALSTVTRAKHLKTPAKNSTTTPIPLRPRGYGGYSVPLSFGTPPQPSDLVFDTGSSLVWLPCTSRYLCSRCAFANVDPAKIPRFIPKASSTSRLIGCRSPMCQWVLGPGSDTNCRKNPNDTCPAYVVQYGSGSTAGLLVSDMLDLPARPVPGFLFGCSVLSIRQPGGIAGFGRGPQSLPSQLGLSGFSYCLVSHRLDDTSFGSDLVLYKNDGGGGDGAGIGYTPFQTNPGSASSAFREYYYVMLRRVFVGGKRVKIPYAYLRPGKDGDGGTIVDSGSTFTFMERPVHEAVAGEFANQMGRYKRARGVENRTGLAPCFDISNEKSVAFPELAFQFKGGAKMELPLANYFSLVSSDGVVACLTLVTSGGPGPDLAGGPAIILGNYQQMNFFVEYDLKNNRFGFRRQDCSK